jgi:hypothetical protein
MKISPVCPAAAKTENSVGWNEDAERQDGAESWICGTAGSKFLLLRFQMSTLDAWSHQSSCSSLKVELLEPDLQVRPEPS